MDWLMIWQSLQSLLLLFLPPFFGVLAAFGLQRYWSWIEDGRAKKRLHLDIKRELGLCFLILQETENELVKNSDSDIYVRKANLLPTDIWKSGVSSGSLKLIPHDRRFVFAQTYFRIECHNSEAERVREISILAASEEKPKTTEPRLFTNLEKLQNELSRRLRDSDAALRKDINNLLNTQNIWN